MSEEEQFLKLKTSYVSHEMKNLLSICRLYSEIMEKQLDKVKFDNGEVEKSFKNAISCISKTVNVANNLLIDFRSIKNVEFQTFDLNLLLARVVKLSKVYIEDKQIEIKLAYDIKKEIVTDENRFISIMINLIKNAIESIEKKGFVSIKAEEVDNSIRITVENNGKPIEKELQKKIFEDGFTTKKSGSGVGLVVCQKTAQELMGSLKLVKSDKKSTIFELKLSNKW